MTRARSWAYGALAFFGAVCAIALCYIAVARSQALPYDQAPDVTAQIAAAQNTANQALAAANQSNNAASQAQMSATQAQATANAAVKPADLVAAAAANLNVMAATTPQFVGGSSAYMTFAQLTATYPCSGASNVLGYLAHISDAWGSVATTLVCEGSAGSYQWRPQRTDYAASVPIASGSITLTPLISAPVIYLPTTPTGSVVITLSTANAWPGATFHIYAPPTISLGSININGLVGGGTVPLLQGTDKVVTYIAGVGWKSN